MKKITLFLILSMVIVFNAGAHKYRNGNAQVTISTQTFYDQLSPYGDWIYSSDYGYVWRPYFDHPESFRPYSSGGNWVYTQYGWTWNSDYTWGWATFHYGRWDFDNYLGWLWIPGSEWAPAWVTWGTYDNYWGWAPLGPNVYAQTTISWYAPDPWWTFVPRNHFGSSDWNYYIYNRPVHINNITYINNIYYDKDIHSFGNHHSWYNGPRVNEVEQYSRSRVRTIDVVDNPRAENTGIHNDRLNVYRPVVDNKRTDYRPADYRRAEQISTGRKIEPTNARANDPGNNTTRVRQDARNITGIPDARTNETNSGTRIETPKPKQGAENRTSDVRVNTNTTNLTRQQTGTPQTGANTETRNQPRMGTQVYPERNQTRTTTQNQPETPRESNSRVTISNSSTQTPARVVNSANSQSRNSNPDLTKVYSNPSREMQRNTAPAAQPTREQKTQNSSAATNSRTENSDRKQATRDESKKNENGKASENADRSNTGNPTRR